MQFVTDGMHKRRELYDYYREQCRRADARSSATDAERSAARAWLETNDRTLFTWVLGLDRFFDKNMMDLMMDLSRVSG